MRDLPPQTHAITLEQGVPAFLDLPQLELDATAVLPKQTECARSSHAPPDDRRLHAAPTGIVRLRT